MKKSDTRTVSGRAIRMAPRNPLVPAARFRRAGAHQPGRKSQRQQAQRTLREALSAEARERYRQT